MALGGVRLQCRREGRPGALAAQNMGSVNSTALKATGATEKQTFFNFEFTDETLTALRTLPVALPVHIFIFRRN